MFYPLPVFIGWRYARGKSGDKFSRFVSVMSTAGITVGVLALVTVLSVMNGFESQLKGRILGVLPHAIVGGQHQPDSSKLLTWPHVTKVAPVLESEAVVQSASSLSAGQLLGIDPSTPDPIGLHMMRGSLDSLQPGKYHIVLGRTLARNLKVRIGDKIRVISTQASQFTPLGRVPSQRNFVVSGIYDTGTDVDDQLFLANIKDVSRLLKRRSSQGYDSRLYLDDPYAISEVARFASKTGVDWRDWRAQRGELFQAVKMERNMMGLMLGLIVLVAAFNIISALVMVVMEKQSEVAILKTQGMTNGQLVSIFVVQGGSSGVIGAIVGGLLGTMLSLNINTVLPLMGINLLGGNFMLPVVVEPLQITFVVVCAVLLSLAATFFPSLKAASVQPAEALRYE